MIKNLPHLLSNTNLFLKCSALFFGYLLWNIVGYNHTITISLTIPVVVYHQGTATINAPESVRVTLRTSRKNLVTLHSTLAVHIDAETLSLGSTIIPLDRSLLFVTDAIDVLHYNPKEITVTRL